MWQRHTSYNVFSRVPSSHDLFRVFDGRGDGCFMAQALTLDQGTPDGFVVGTKFGIFLARHAPFLAKLPYQGVLFTCLE
jgi:hypothetical protein